MASNRPGRLLAQIPPFGHPSWDGCFLQRFVNEIGFKPPRVPPGPDSSFRAPFVRAQVPCENNLLYVSLHVYVCILYMHVHASVRTCVRGRSVLGCVFFPEFRNVSPIIIMLVVFVSRVAGIP